MNKGFFGCVLLGMMSLTHASDLAGTWRTVDDKTGYVRAIVQVEKMKDNTYVGTIVKDFPAPGELALTHCQNCPAPFTNKPIIGLTILQKFRANPDSKTDFIDAKVLDPRSGKTYQAKARLNSSGNRLTLRGFIGISLIGRSQTWIRQE